MPMNRRDMLKTLAAGAVAGVALTDTSRKYGPVTIDRHRQLCQRGVHLHVLHDGRDITLDCRYADDTGEGMAEVFLRNANGRHYVDRSTDSLASAIVHGVTLIEGAPFGK